MKVYKKPSIFFVGLWVGLLMMMVLLLVSSHSADGTKEWKFLGYGTYIVPEDFPDKFLDFPARLLAKEDIAGKAVMGVAGHQSEPTSTGESLLVLVAYYSPNDVIYILAIKTISVKSVECIYIDKQLLETGKPSLILTKTDGMPDFNKFKRERELEFRKVRI